MDGFSRFYSEEDESSGDRDEATDAMRRVSREKKCRRGAFTWSRGVNCSLNQGDVGPRLTPEGSKQAGRRFPVATK